jgi:hypothetical protein
MGVITSTIISKKKGIGDAELTGSSISILQAPKNNLGIEKPIYDLSPRIVSVTQKISVGMDKPSDANNGLDTDPETLIDDVRRRSARLVCKIVKQALAHERWLTKRLFSAFAGATNAFFDALMLHCNPRVLAFSPLSTVKLIYLNRYETNPQQSVTILE